MFPIKTLRRPEKFPLATYTIIAVNILVFAWELTLSAGTLNQQFMAMAVVPCEMSRNLFSVETLLDSVRTMFLHGGFVHVAGNMIFLYLFGPNLESYLGKARFLFFYFAAGLAANLVHTAINWNVCVPVIGASGAVFGVMAGFFLIYPATRIRIVNFFFRIPVGTSDVAAFYAVGYFIIVNLVNAITAWGDINKAVGGVAVWAHIGGFFAGLVLAFVFMLFRDPPPVDPFEYLDAD